MATIPHTHHQTYTRRTGSVTAGERLPACSQAASGLPVFPQFNLPLCRGLVKAVLVTNLGFVLSVRFRWTITVGGILDAKDAEESERQY